MVEECISTHMFQQAGGLGQHLGVMPSDQNRCEIFLFLEGIYLALKSHLQLRKVLRPEV